MVNRVILVGRLTQDPIARVTTTGKDTAEFSIAVGKRFKPQDGSPDAFFFRVKAWGQTASFATQYLAKGRLVAVEGRLEQRRYTDREGINREIYEIVADNLQGLDRPRDDQGGGGDYEPRHRGGAYREVAFDDPDFTNPAPDEHDPYAMPRDNDRQEPVEVEHADDPFEDE